MRCNYRCVGCWADGYAKNKELSPDRLLRLIDEAKEMGIFFITLTGGEPFLRKDLFPLFEKHPDVTFQVFTNGSLLNDRNYLFMAEQGNVFPVISINGLDENNDLFRGNGAFDKAIDAMRKLKDHNVLHAFSVVVTRTNMEEVVSDGFLQMMVDCGCLYGWYYLYMPVGNNPDPALMPSPGQRDRLRSALVRQRRRFPMLLCDFFNDSPIVGGCMSAGRRYVHINSGGDVEPCVFCHFSVDNINDCSLHDALRSDFLRTIREQIPFHKNLLRPCLIIDNPGILEKCVKKHGAKATHGQADRLFSDYSEVIEQYSRDYAEVVE